MTAIKRPARLFSFTDWNKTRPKEPPPGDRLDAQFTELAHAILSTQEALAQIRRDDGGLKNNSVNEEQLVTGLREKIVGDIAKQLEPIRQSVSGTAINAQNSERNAQSFAEDAEAAVSVAHQLAGGMAAIRTIAESKAEIASRAAKDADIDAIDAENWGNYAQAQADNAIEAKNEALQWAEYLAGPVVNALEAPAYIANTPFPQGLYYQPVQGGVAGLWSAKWWALWAQQLVGKTAVYYLGPWDHGPVPGEQNPITGEVVPDPLSQGSFYYDTGDATIKVWTGSEWKEPLALGQGFQSSFVYFANDGQTTFNGSDIHSATPNVGTSPSTVFVNGVRLVEGSDYTVDGATDTLTINSPVTGSSVVQWDLLVSPDQLAPGSVNAWKIKHFNTDGTTTNFPLQYVDGTGATVDANVGGNAELQVSVDGCTQEPGHDYTATGNSISFATPPDVTARVWIIWYQPGAPA